MPDNENTSETARQEEKMEKKAAETSKAQRGRGAAQMPPIDFSMFIFSLNSSVLVNLGVIDDPVSGMKTKDLPAAKQTIDIMAMLQEKTRGNLTQQEEDMLKHFLYDLKMMYVREAG